MSKKSHLITLLGALVALAVALPQQQASASVPATCSTPLVLAVDGTKGPHTPTSIDPASPLNAIADDYLGLGYAVQHVEYPGGILAGVAGWTQDYDDSVAIGLSNLRNRIGAQERACNSSTRYVLLGYSQGARIVGDLAAEIDRGALGTDLADRVQVRLYADPRQPETGIEVALAGEKAPDGVTFTGERAPFRVVEVEWICAPTDGVCDAREPLGPETFVGYLATHTSYR
ncbi:PE-PPE domain-containing protein [Rhodococcus erythropolis]|uniref:PE-PPE domain-containing protein n=1 Tax=Rhodococcus erythropolis TaxID=1833 RepID=UPI0008CE468A|nr:PE-PPE domain-containing protein [Rhodococcus erythropolis]OFV79224.1 PE-PPE domain protein [Rhodococcus erythropolis]